MRNNRRLLLPLCLVLATPVAHAEKADQYKQMVLTAQKGCSLNQIEGFSECSGKVVVTQGTTVIHAEYAKATRDAKGNQTLVATGKPVTFRQKADDTPDRKNEWIEGQADRINYNTIDHTLTLTSNARIKKGNDQLIADVIVYNTETQVYQSLGGSANTANKGRVTAIIQPQKKAADNGAGKQP